MDLLTVKMGRLIAEGHPRSDELRQAIKNVESVDIMKDKVGEVLSIWARARRLYVECKGLDGLLEG